MLRYLTAGESHGSSLTAIVDGMPAGLEISAQYIDRDLERRQSGWGRGARMKIEKDRVEITSGVRWGRTLGSPVALAIKNLDWENWVDVMGPGVPSSPDTSRNVTRPRPGHADLTGGIKYGHRDLRNILERSSARETAARVAAGALAKRLLEQFGINVYSWVVEIGGVRWASGAKQAAPATLFKLAEGSDVRCPDRAKTEEMKSLIDAAKKDGDSLGGIFEVTVTGVPPGLGSHVQWDRKLDGKLAGALMSIQAIKGVEVGMGFGVGSTPGSLVHDEIFYKGSKPPKSKGGPWWPQLPCFYRRTNNSGGIEGGMSNGEPVVLRAAMKPIPTLYKPLRSVDIETKLAFKASVERSDTCAVPAAAVIAESVVAIEIANAFIEKFGSDTVEGMGKSYSSYIEEVTGY